jgi:sec-independent protein translocase protein TatB
MFNIDPSEFLLVGVVALVVIGPKDLPRAMRFVGQWVGRARGMARHFRSGFDEMVRQAEIEEMEKRWKSENARIMAEHPAPSLDEDADAYHAAGYTPDGDPPPPALPAPAADAGMAEYHAGELPDVRGGDPASEGDKPGEQRA